MPSDNPPSEAVTFEQAMQKACSYLTKLIKRTENQVVKREATLLSCQNWTKVHHQALLLQSNLYRIKKGMDEAIVSDWEEEGKERTISLDKLVEPKDQIATLFVKSKKLHLGIPYAEKQLQLMIEILNSQKELFAKLQSIISLEELQAFHKAYPFTVPPQKHQKLVKKTEPAKPYHIYKSESGLFIWVGKNAKNNDVLTFHHANGSDWWFHAHNYPGSHVVLHGLKRGQDPDQASIQDAAELALRFSKAKDIHGEGEVTVSQVKYLNRVKGSPGKVQISKHRVMHIQLDLQRWNRLKK